MTELFGQMSLDNKNKYSGVLINTVTEHSILSI